MKNFHNCRFFMLIVLWILRGSSAIAQSDSVKILLTESNAALIQNKIELSISKAQTAFDKSKTTGFQLDIGESATVLGLAYRNAGKMDKAEEYLFRAVHTFEKTAHYDRYARSLLELGRTKQTQRNFAEAIELYTQSLTVYNDKLTPTEATQNLDLKALILERMAVILSNQKQLDEAEKYALEAYNLCEKIGEKGRWEITATTVGNVYWWKNDYKKGAFYYEKAYNLAKDIGRNTGRTLNNLGMVAAKTGEFDKAIGYYTEAIEQYKIIVAPNMIAQTQINMAELYTAKGDFSNAIILAKLGTDELIRLKSLTGLVEGYETLVTAYMKSGDLTTALSFQKKYTHFKDSLYANNRQKDLLEFQTKFETEKKDKEIKLLNSENTLRYLQLQQKNLDLTNQKLLTEKNEKNLALLRQSKALQESELSRTTIELDNEKQINENKNAQLALFQKDIKIKEQEAAVQSKNNQLLRGVLLALLAAAFVTWQFLRYQQRIKKEREEVAQLRAVENAQRQWQETELRALRSQMNPHFIFNCLNSIKNLTLKNDTDKASIYITKFSRLMRQVLENSRNEWVSLHTELENLLLYMDMEKLRFQDKFIYQIDLKNNLNPHDFQIPPMLIQPYVENAIWHGLMHKTSSGKVTISITEIDNNVLEINIIDNGIGRKASAELKSKSANEQKSFGLQITAERMAILNQYYHFNATSTLTDLYDDLGNPVGTKVCLKIPI